MSFHNCASQADLIIYLFTTPIAIGFAAVLMPNVCETCFDSFKSLKVSSMHFQLRAMEIRRETTHKKCSMLTCEEQTVSNDWKSPNSWNNL